MKAVKGMLIKPRRLSGGVDSEKSRISLRNQSLRGFSVGRSHETKTGKARDFKESKEEIEDQTGHCTCCLTPSRHYLGWKCRGLSVELETLHCISLFEEIAGRNGARGAGTYVIQVCTTDTRMRSVQMPKKGAAETTRCDVISSKL